MTTCPSYSSWSWVLSDPPRSSSELPTNQVHPTLHHQNYPQVRSTPLFVIRTAHKSSPPHSLSSELPTNQVQPAVHHRNYPQIKSTYTLLFVRTAHKSSPTRCSSSELPTDQVYVYPALRQNCLQIKSTPLFFSIVHKPNPHIPRSLSELSTNQVHPTLC